RALSLVLGLAACTEVPADEPADRPADPSTETPTPAASCAAAPLNALTGFALQRNQGSGATTETRADVTWTLTATDGCTDRYTPSGTVTYAISGDAPVSAPIAATDGELIIDRTTLPRTYTMTGAAAIGGMWTDHEG